MENTLERFVSGRRLNSTLFLQGHEFSLEGFSYRVDRTCLLMEGYFLTYADIGTALGTQLGCQAFESAWISFHDEPAPENGNFLKDLIVDPALPSSSCKGPLYEHRFRAKYPPPGVTTSTEEENL